MKLGRWLLAACLLVGAASTIFVFRGSAFGGGDVLPSDADAQNRVAGPVAAEATGTVEAPSAEGLGAQREATERAARFMGRCIDAATGSPLAGCAVAVARSRQVTRATGNSVSTSVERELLAESSTGPDGRFDLPATVIPRWRFELSARMEGYAPVTGYWYRFDSDSDTDVGDLLMARGSRIVGRVVDTDGHPRAGSTISARPSGPPVSAPRMHARRYCDLKTGRDGSFETEEVLQVGRWMLELERGLFPVDPRALLVDLEPGRAVTAVEIVVKAERDLEKITGVVVDETGAPCEGLRLLPHPFSPIDMHVAMSTTDAQGRFVFYRHAQSPSDAVQIRSEPSTGYEELRDPRTLAWGTTDLRLVARRLLSIDLQVVHAEDGRPVERYGVFCYQLPGMLTRELNRGRHPEGRLHFSNLRRGENRLIVKPMDEGLLPSSVILVDTRVPGSDRLRVELRRPVTRRLDVRRTDGAPVAGTRVELLRLLPETRVSLHTGLLRRSDSSWTPWRGAAFLLQSGDTDSAGELELLGPPGENVAIRLLGPGHVPVVFECLRLDVKAPYRAVVTVGATLRGFVRPASFVQRLQPSGAVRDRRERIGRNVSSRLEAIRPNLSLTSLNLTRRQFLPVPPMKFPVQSDGSFEIVGIPPGSWRIDLRFHLMGRNGMTRWSREELGSAMNVAEGEERTIELDASKLALATVEGRVLVNGRPHASAPIGFTGTRLGADGRTKSVSAAPATTDEQGRFVVDALPATYRAVVKVHGADPRYGVDIRSTTELELVAGQKATAVFEIHSAALKLRILASDGATPVAGREFQVTQRPGFSRAYMRSDARGWLVIDPVPCGELSVTTWPVQLATIDARRAYRKQSPGRSKAIDARRIEVGKVFIPAGKKQASFTLRMPEGVK